LPWCSTPCGATGWSSGSNKLRQDDQHAKKPNPPLTTADCCPCRDGRCDRVIPSAAAYRRTAFGTWRRRTPDAMLRPNRWTAKRTMDPAVAQTSQSVSTQTELHQALGPMLSGRHDDLNRDRGASRDAAPPTPPGIRVRTTAVRRIKRPPVSPLEAVRDDGNGLC
jgi:hypothetical protein